MAFVHDIDDAAKELKCSPRHIYNEIAAGRLKSFKMGRRRKITDEALREYVKALEAESASA